MIAGHSRVSKGSLRRQLRDTSTSEAGFQIHTSSHSLRGTVGGTKMDIGTALASPIDMDACDELLNFGVHSRGHTTFRQALTGLSRRRITLLP